MKKLSLLIILLVLSCAESPVWGEKDVGDVASVVMVPACGAMVPGTINELGITTGLPNGCDPMVPVAGVSSGTAGCSQATTFLARTSLTGSDATNYTNLICGLVTDGVITGTLSGTSSCGTGSFDAAYILATHDTSTAILNLCGTANTLSPQATPTFTAYSGYSSGGNSANFLAGPDLTTLTNYTQNAAHASVWVVTNHGTTENQPEIDCNNHTVNIYAEWTDGNSYERVNDNSSGFANATSSGYYFADRTSSTGRTAYKNGASLGTYGSTASSAILTGNCFFPYTGNADTIAFVSVGGNLDSLQLKIYNRLRTYMTAVGVP